MDGRTSKARRDLQNELQMPNNMDIYDQVIIKQINSMKGMIKIRHYFLFNINDVGHMIVTSKISCYYDIMNALPDINNGQFLHMQPPDYTLSTWQQNFFNIDRNNLNQIVSVNNSQMDNFVCECTLDKSEIFELSKCHDVTQYIDDSSSIIAFNDKHIVESYLKVYLLVLKNYYSMCKLKLNETKTVLLAVSQKKSDKQSLKIEVQGEIIKSVNQIKMLGCISNTEGNSVSDLNRTLSICYNSLERIKKARKLIDNKTCGIFVKSYVMSRLSYMSFAYVNLPAYHINRMHKLII